MKNSLKFALFFLALVLFASCKCLRKDCSKYPFEISPPGMSLIESYQKLVSGERVICDSNNTILVTSTMPAEDYAFKYWNKKSDKVTISTIFDPKQPENLSSFNTMWTFRHISCRPDSIVIWPYSKTDSTTNWTTNDSYFARFIPVKKYKEFTGEFKNYKSLEGFGEIMVTEIKEIKNPHVELTDGYIYKTEREHYQDSLSCKGLVFTIILKNNNEPIECYLIANYNDDEQVDTDGKRIIRVNSSVVWKTKRKCKGIK